MATGVIQNLSEFKLPSTFQFPVIYSSLHDEDYRESSEEEEEFMEEDEIYEMEEENPTTTMSQKNTQTQQSFSVDGNAEMTLQLLKFSDLISSDIQRYFGQKTKEEDPDSCNIYEDYFTPQMSAQEMYYHDMAKLAQHRGQDSDNLFDPLTPPVELDQKILRSICGEEEANKLGPLAELFDFGLRKYSRQKVFSNKEARPQKLDRKYAHIVPMHRRTLPLSFWKEPNPIPSCILNNNLPDFSDLLENWTSDTSHELQSTSRDLSSVYNR
ncbi:protein PERCC1 [Discoglossus pictus]